MQEGANTKQQIVEKLKNTTNILVTVSSNPSVDALSAALGLTLMLNKMDKHGTAVFSGAVPPAIQFLEPEKTFEGTVDSLRDFIIALDKEKADRLRYKVDGDMVRIFITPYRTTITEKDLEFSSGDFNVETIIALGVEKREELDKAIAQHGRILHDATVMTINDQKGSGNLGSIDWQDPDASSLCEMLMSLSEALQSGLMDEQISTALLTGIVAATDRFSNEHTKPRVMTMAAQLMAAGANQQLIATKLENSHIIKPATASKPKSSANPDGSMYLKENASSKVNRDEPEPKKDDGKKKDDTKKDNAGEADKKPEAAKPEKPAEKEKTEEKPADGEIQIDHESDKDKPPAPPEARIESATAGMTPEQIAAKNQNDAVNAAEGALADALPGGQLPIAPQSPTLADLEHELKREGESAPAAPQPEAPAPSLSPDPKESNDGAEPKKVFTDQPPSWMGRRIEPPTMGGTLSATSEEALQDKLRAEEEERNHTILNHGERPVNENQPPPLTSSFAPGQLPPVSPTESAPAPGPAPSPLPPQPPANAPVPVGDQPPDNVNAARDAVNAALNAGGSPMPDYEATPPPASYAPPSGPQPSPNVTPTGAYAPPPLPDMNQLPPLPPAPIPPSSAPPAGPGLQAPEQLPQASSASNTPPPQAGGQPDPFGLPPLQPDNNKPADPGQFRIPGQ